MGNSWWTVKVLFKQPMTSNQRKYVFGFLLMIISSLLILSSCKHKDSQADMAGPDEYYTCSMDPQVIENHAGNCPICHMKLIKVNKNMLKAGQIQLSNQQIQLANITFDTLWMQELAKEVTLTGRITIDENLSDAISSRVGGRIVKLFVKNAGEYVSKGQLLLEMYSEDLNSAQHDYVFSLQNNSTSENLVDAAKSRLLLYGMNESQIDQIKSTKQILEIVPVYALTDGFVSEMSLSEGDYVSTGTVLFRLASLNSLWVEAQVYLPYLPYLKIGTEAKFSIPAVGEKLFSGKVIFIDPQIQSPERFVLARFQISNPSQQIKPGMLANISLQVEKKEALVLPSSGIIQDSKGTNVWIRNSDGVFEYRMVTVGMQNSRQVEITDGLVQGDIVVITGSYLLNSEYVFKKGTNPMEGQTGMEGMKM